MFKRILALAAALLFAVSVMPLALAKPDIPTRYTTPSGYNKNDYQKLVRFLEIKNEDGVKNGEKLNEDYDPTDPETWLGIEWNSYGRLINFYNNYNRLVGDLDLTGCTRLKRVYMYYCDLGVVDMSGCTSLEYLDIFGWNASSVNVSGCSALKELYIYYTPELDSLDITGCTKLTNVCIGDTGLTSADLSACPDLEELRFPNNMLKALVVPGTSDLRLIDIENNSVKTLDLTGCDGLEYIRCSDNALTALDVTGCPELTQLYCSGNKITKLDLTNCTKLREIDSTSNRLTSLNFNKCTEFEVGRVKAETGGYVGFQRKSVYHFYDDGTGALIWTLLAQATHKSGYKFAGWYDGNGELVTKDYDCFLEYGADRIQLTAKFTEGAQLAAPAVTASNVEETGKIKLSWKAVPGAAKYQVWRADFSGGDYKLLKTTASTSFINTSTVTCRSYVYRVRAVDSDGFFGDYCEEVPAFCRLPRPVVTGTHVASTGKNKLTWEPMEYASSYKVYRATSKDGTYKQIGVTNDDHYIDSTSKAGTTYYYKVKAAYYYEEGDSAFSEIKTLTCDLARPVVTISLSNGKPKLTWKAITGAKEYKIYRRVGTSGDYTLMKTTTNLSYTNTSAVAGKTYYYKVMAIHEKSAANSAYSAAKSITATK